MNLLEELQHLELQHETRRHFLKTCTTGLGAMAMASLWGCSGSGASAMPAPEAGAFLGNIPHFAPRAKRVIYLHMAGSPSQLELFVYKPELQKLHDQLCPQSLLEGKRFAFISGVPKMLGHQAEFKQHG